MLYFVASGANFSRKGLVFQGSRGSGEVWDAGRDVFVCDREVFVMFLVERLLLLLRRLATTDRVDLILTYSGGYNLSPNERSDWKSHI